MRCLQHLLFSSVAAGKACRTLGKDEVLCPELSLTRPSSRNANQPPALPPAAPRGTWPWDFCLLHLGLPSAPQCSEECAVHIFKLFLLWLLTDLMRYDTKCLMKVKFCGWTHYYLGAFQWEQVNPETFGQRAGSKAGITFWVQDEEGRRNDFGLRPDGSAFSFL